MFRYSHDIAILWAYMGILSNIMDRGPAWALGPPPVWAQGVIAQGSRIIAGSPTWLGLSDPPANQNMLIIDRQKWLGLQLTYAIINREPAIHNILVLSIHRSRQLI